MRQATGLVRTRGQRLRPVSSRVCFGRNRPLQTRQPAVRQSKTLRSRLWRSSMRRPCMKPPNAWNAARCRTRRVNFSVGAFQRPSARATTSCMCLRRTPALPCRSCSCCTAARKSRRLCARHARESMGREQRLAGCLSRADSTRERAPLLELVSPERPASRPREPAIIAGIVRQVINEYPIDATCLCRWLVGGRRDGCHHGA